jgi:hypothetical protein
MQQIELVSKKVSFDFFVRILLKPFISVILYSFWPFLLLILPSLPNWVIILFYSVQVLSIIFFISLFLKLIKFIKFPSFIQAQSYYSDLIKVKKLELKAKRIEKNNLIIQMNKRRIEIEEARLKQLQSDLEDRKRKVL